MEPYAGIEPRIGEIRALRTFRIGPDATLYPLFGRTAWRDGTNTAHCRCVDAGPDHRAPEPDCACGFYAYGNARAARDYPQATHVLAVVSCWGRVIAGTRGVRSEFARLDALWLADTVPAELAMGVDLRYPSTVVFRDRAAMLAAHPPTALDCYVAPPSARRIAALRGAVLLLAVALWIIAPFGGPVGIALLRAPLLVVAALLLAMSRLLRRSGRRFPAVIEESD